jgi:hypothetical protein
MRFRHLRDSDKYLYSLLEIRGQLYSHLAEIDETAERRVESFMEEALRKNPIPEDLKNSNPLEWAGRMENLRAQAEEIVTRELIFTEPERPEFSRARKLPEPGLAELGLDEMDGELEELMDMPF